MLVLLIAAYNHPAAVVTLFTIGGIAIITFNAVWHSRR